MHRNLIFLVLILFSSCINKEGEKYNLDGVWIAKWKTLPESFSGIENITSYEMNGQFIFSGDSVTIIAMGFPGCVFGIDTLKHTQGWKFSNDTTLSLINDSNIQGISYLITSKSMNNIELQLMDDIFVSLRLQD